MNHINKIIFLLTIGLIQAQVGIGGNNPDPNSSIDVLSSNKGVLLPQVALTDNLDEVTIASPAEGLYVFNTVDSGTSPNEVNADNYYYWDGVKWNQIINEHDLTVTLNSLKTPKLAGYVYKLDQEQRFDFAQGPIIATLSEANSFYQFTDLVSFADPMSSTNSEIIVHQTGYYAVDAFVCTLFGTSLNDWFHPALTIEKSSDGGVTWVNTRVKSFAEYNRISFSSLTIPIYATGVLDLTEGDRLRMKLSANFDLNSGSYADFSYAIFAKSNVLGVQYSAGMNLILFPQ